MQVAVIGAGAVGCYYGGLLLRAGHDVTFIGRRTHVDAINTHGLLLDTKSFKGHLPAKAATDATALASPDLVLFCVKSADTEEAGRSLAGRLRPETSILSLQNGVDNPQRLFGVTGHPVIPAVVYVGSEMAGPGPVRHHGGGDLAIGASPASKALAQTLDAAGIRTTIADDIETTLWSTAQDVARGKPSEIDFLNGYVVRKGAELGIPTPTNHALQVMVKLAERRSEISGGRG